MAKYTYPSIPECLINEEVNSQLEICICIPCYNEQDIESTINSLMACKSIDGYIQLIILINDSEKDTEAIIAQNKISYDSCVELKEACKHKGISLNPVHLSKITAKKAGVGYARRLAMDEASRRFSTIDKNRGIIACLDADTTVSDNYLIELIDFFKSNEDLSACSIAFEHDLHIKNEPIRSAICDYESHLRYFINMQRLIGLPFAYQTVGSAMAVTARSYQKLGGMNVRKAGEDFYFLHKFIKNSLAGELNSACVFPSARVSDRVPFGTGKAVGDIINSGLSYQTYNIASFTQIDSLVKMLPEIYNQAHGSDIGISGLSETLCDYLRLEKLTDKINEIRSNTTSYNSFTKRFFQWFDAFRLMKCLHYLRDNGYPNIEVSDGMEFLFKKLGLSWREDKYENLRTLRRYDKSKQSILR